MTLLYTDPLFLKHDTGPRLPETVARALDDVSPTET